MAIVCIPKESQKRELAEMYINFMLEPEVGMANTDAIGYSTPNAPALQLLGEEYIDNETYTPPQALLDKCEIFHDLGDFITVYNDAWNRVKSYVG